MNIKYRMCYQNSQMSVNYSKNIIDDALLIKGEENNLLIIFILKFSSKYLDLK
jgi:hypothetical protein